MKDARLADALRSALQRRLGVDLRALAAFRIGLGFLLLADLVHRAQDLTAFYTDAGVLPRATLAELFPVLSQLSIHAQFGSVWFQALCFVVAGTFAVLMTVGYRTRLVAPISWLLLASIQLRNYFVLNGGDTVLLVALFVGCFLPLGERWSVDAVWTGPTRERVTGFATAALLTQIVLVYATNAVFKFRGDLWPSGTAVQYVFAIDRFTVFLGEYLAGIDPLLEAINWVWLAMLVASPLLLAGNMWVRSGLVAAFAGAHLGMALTMSLGLFPFVMIVSLLCFVPSPVWNRLEHRIDPVGTRLATLVTSSWPRLDRSPSVELAVPTPIRNATRRAVPVVTATILVVGLLWQAAAVGVVATPDDAVVEPEEHSWKLFAPGVPRADGWYVAPAELESGDHVNVYPHGDANGTRPDDVGDTYPNFRWRKYLTRLRGSSDARRRAFATYLCSAGAERYGEPVERLRIEFVREPVALDGTADQSRITLGNYTCTDRGTGRPTTLSIDAPT